MDQKTAEKYLDLGGVIFVALNSKGEITQINRKGCEILGYEQNELLGKNWFEYCLPQYLRSEVRETFQRLMKGKTRAAEYHENPVLTRSGAERFMSWHNAVMTDEAGRPIGTLSSGLDITERIHAEEALRESEARMRAIVDTAVDGIIIIDESGTVESFNPAAERLFGFPASEVIGENVSILMPAPYHEEHNAYIQNYLKTGEKKIIGIGREVVGRRKDGSTFPLYVAVGEVQLDKRRVFTGIVHDLSEQKSLQQRIIQSERLAVIGKMAAKVAHEVRNPLSSISLNAELLLEEIQSPRADPNEAKSLLKSMIMEIDRVSSLTDEYLQFSRLPEAHPVQDDLNGLLREVVELLAPELRKNNIKPICNGLMNSLNIPFDRAQVRRVLLNLVRNAIESMPGGGTLQIASSKSENECHVTIKDCGVGIPEDKVENIFDPFFTTKDFGTGLGLAISQQIIHEHRGQISCDSKVGVGTTFRIDLPLNNAPVRD
ncbi:MAG: PAS domain S-box protein [bacterium]